jgi:hypothetical protein
VKVLVLFGFLMLQLVLGLLLEWEMMSCGISQ